MTPGIWSGWSSTGVTTHSLLPRGFFWDTGLYLKVEYSDGTVLVLSRRGAATQVVTNGKRWCGNRSRGSGSIARMAYADYKVVYGACEAISKDADCESFDQLVPL